jgi:formate dehydrogenase major subunit
MNATVVVQIEKNGRRRLVILLAAFDFHRRSADECSREGLAVELRRRGFIKLTGAGLAASTLGAIGFGAAGEALAAAVRPFKLAATSETRNTCTYCSVACGVLIYSRGDRAKNARSSIIHIEGDPDHPVNRGTLCPKGSALLDIVHAPTRLKVPRYRAPGSDQLKLVSWDFALDRIATLMKQDRDANFVAQNANGTTVNRWTSTGMLAASASSTETSYVTWKVARALGMLVFDNQARV